jgi:hypothetical protein
MALFLLIYLLYYRWANDIRKSQNFDIEKWTLGDSCFFKKWATLKYTHPRHMLICLFISMLLAKEKEWNSYKDRRWLLGEKNEIVGLGNVVIIFGIVSKIVQGWPHKERCKINCARIVVQKLMQNFQHISSSKKIVIGISCVTNALH